MALLNNSLMAICIVQVGNTLVYPIPYCQEGFKGGVTIVGTKSEVAASPLPSR